MLKRFEEAKANDAIEGIFLTGEEEALFMRMIDQGLSEEESNKVIDAYLADKLNKPSLVAAE